MKTSKIKKNTSKKNRYIKNKAIIFIVPIIVLLISCEQEKIDDVEKIKLAVVDQARFKNNHESLEAGCLLVKSLDKYEFLLTGKLYEIKYYLIRPMVYFYAMQKDDSIFILKGVERLKRPEKVRNIVSFLNFQSLTTEQNIRSFIDIYLKVITSNYADSLINSIQEIDDLELFIDEGGQYVKFKDKAKIYIDPFLVRTLSINRSRMMGTEKIHIFFNTINYFSGYLYFNKIYIDDKGSYDSDRMSLLRVLPGKMVH